MIFTTREKIAFFTHTNIAIYFQFTPLSDAVVYEAQILQGWSDKEGRIYIVKHG